MDRNDDPRDLGEATPSDRDALVGDTAASDRLTDAPALEEGREAKPPRTEGKIATPRFGSAGSGGAELEPGPERP